MKIGKVIGSVYGVPVLVGSTWKREDGVIVEISECEDAVFYTIKGTHTGTKEWSSYTYNGKLRKDRHSLMDLLDLVSNPEQAVKEPEQVSYTKEQLREAWTELNWADNSWSRLVEVMGDINKKNNDPEYEKYLELKAKFEG